jgi:hypothetical protein
MARKDEILKSLLKHQLLQDKYDLNQDSLPKTVREALKSKITIVKAIALIVEGLDGSAPITDSVLRIQITQFLNEAL